jgi:3-hydroxyisobutyrate dehydrogenase-like beta-hydroxyacid dehydrogenase
MVVGFIGLGTMGRNAALNVRRAGFDMVVYDVRLEAMEALAAVGAAKATGPADVLDRSDIVVTMVFGPKEIEQVVRGESGFLTTSCAGKYWIDMTTSSPKLMRALAGEFQAKGGGPVEAMVTAKLAGLEPEVWWNVMKGGAADSFVLQHDVPSIFAGHYDPSFPIALCLKDLGLIEELMTETGTRNELTRATHDRFKLAGERYGVGAGEMTVCKVIEDDANVSLRVAGDWVAPWEVAHPAISASR